VEVRQGVEDGDGGKHALTVEAQALTSHRRAQIKPAARREDARQLAQRTMPPARIDRITISSEAHVLDRVKARQRLDRARLERIETAHVAPNERQSLDRGLERADIDDGDGHEGEQVRDEAVNARPDVHVSRRTLLKDASRGPQILVEVMPARDACLSGEVRQDGLEIPGGERKTAIRRAAVFGRVPHEEGQPPERRGAMEVDTRQRGRIEERAQESAHATSCP
jgi:hypothetical protein